jgi:hypothetical protein
MIDDELVITIRVRLTTDQRGLLETQELGEAVGAMLKATMKLPGTLTGIEAVMPSFEPYPDKEADGQG